MLRLSASVSLVLMVACAGEAFRSDGGTTSNAVLGASGSAGTGSAVTSGRGGASFGGGANSLQGGTDVAPGAAGENAGGVVAIDASGGSPAVGDGGASPAAGGIIAVSRGGAQTGAGGAIVQSSGGVSLGVGGVLAIPSGGMPSASGGVTGGTQIRACRELPSGSPSGTYSIDPDGSGPLSAVDASCDMDSAGGGWTLVLNYVHKAGTNPALSARKDSLPLLGADQLGVDESGSSVNWGHATATLIAALQPVALRFHGRISAHTRIVDFWTEDKPCLAYVSGGTTSCKGVANAYNPLPTHTARLPHAATAFMSGKGDLALTEYPFYLAGEAHWGIHGETTRWEVDNTPVTGMANNLYDTIHRVWVR